MKQIATSVLVALALAAGSSAQTGFGFSVAPVPNYIITPFGAGGSSPSSTIESVQHMKLSNNADGAWTTAVTVGKLGTAYGGDNTSLGVAMGIFEPYNFLYTANTEASALNSSNHDLHLALSPDGLWAIFERRHAVSGIHLGVFLANRAAVGTPFGAPVAVTGFPASLLINGEVHPYLGPVGGTMMCFYTDGDNLLMQPITLSATTPALTGTATVVAREVQNGTQPGSPSPIFGGDGDVEMLWACDIVLPQTFPGTGDADPVLHNDLRPSTPGLVQVQRTDWQGFGGIAGGFVYFSHDIVPMHVMHAEGSILVGDSEAPGGTADLRTMAPNWGSPAPLQGAILLGTGLSAPIPLPGFYGALGLSGFAPLVLPTITTRLDGIATISFPIPDSPALSGASLPLQALTVDSGPPLNITWSNTAWLHIN